MKNVLNKNYKRLYVDSELSSMNYQNFLKQYWISIKYSFFFGKSLKKMKFLDTRHLKASDFSNFRTYLKEEERQLDKFIEFTYSNEKKSEVDYEIERLEEILSSQNKENKTNILKFNK